MTSLLLLKSILFANALQQDRKSKKKRKVKTEYPSEKLNLSQCRVCNRERGEHAIFNNSVQPYISEEIKSFTGVVIDESDSFSKHICHRCLDLLNGCILFRDLCQKTNQMFLESKVKNEYIDDVDIIEARDHSDDSYNIPSPTFSLLDYWECSTCNKEFANLESYNDHEPICSSNQKSKVPRVKKEIKRFLCDVCGKTCFSNANLLAHKGIHENIFPFKCDVCPYQGRTRDLLKVHKRSHMTDKPFKCSQCPKATTTSSNLAKHMKQVHSTNRPYKCTYCDRAFSYQHDMKRHVKEMHLRQGTVECDVCYKSFNTKKILRGHRFKVHKIKGERQGRLPSYLQCQKEDDNNGSDMIECDANYAC